VLALAVGAVAPRARSFVAIAEWAADLLAAAAEAIGVVGRFPSESKLRRVVQAVDADRFDAVLGGYVQHHVAARAPRAPPSFGSGRRDRARVAARRGNDVEVAGWHLLAATNLHTRVGLGQIAVPTTAIDPGRRPVRSPQVGLADEQGIWAR
jgi:hypothetical protein